MSNGWLVYHHKKIPLHFFSEVVFIYPNDYGVFTQNIRSRMTSVEKHWKKTSFQEDIYFNITSLSTPLHHNLYSANCSLQFPYGTHGLYTDNLFPNQELLGNHFPYSLDTDV